MFPPVVAGVGCPHYCAKRRHRQTVSRDLLRVLSDGVTRRHRSSQRCWQCSYTLPYDTQLIMLHPASSVAGLRLRHVELGRRGLEEEVSANDFTQFA